MGRNQIGRKSPKFTHIHLAKITNLQPRPPMLDLLLVEYLYMINKHNCIKETRIKSKEISKPSHMWWWSLVWFLTWSPLYPSGFDFSSTKLGQLWPCHPRPCQGQQLSCWPPCLTLTRLTSRELPSGDFELKRRWSTFWNVANLCQNDHHPHHSFSLII